MVVIQFNVCKNVKWKSDLYEADSHNIEECHENKKDASMYILMMIYDNLIKLLKILLMLLTMAFVCACMTFVCACERMCVCRFEFALAV